MSKSISFSEQHSAILFRIIISSESSPYHKLLEKMNGIDTDYFEKIPAWTEQLPSELDFQLKDNILNDFDKLADKLLNQELKNKCIAELIEAKENTASSEKEIIEGAMASIKQFATLYFGREKPCPKVDEDTLHKKYKRAKRRSLGEHIIQSNKADIIDFHHALMYKTVWECKDLIEARTIQFIEEVIKDFVATILKLDNNTLTEPPQ